MQAFYIFTLTTHRNATVLMLQEQFGSIASCILDGGLAHQSELIPKIQKLTVKWLLV